MSLQPSLNIRSRYRGPAFRAIETVLREDPVLAEQVKTWRTRQGVAGELAPASSGKLPMIALSPIPNPSTVLGVDETKINFAVAVEVVVPGTCVDDLFALWEAVEDAIVDSKPFREGTVQSFLCGAISQGPAGVRMLRPAAPAFSAVSLVRPTADQDQITYQAGVGTLTCFVRRPA